MVHQTKENENKENIMKAKRHFTTMIIAAILVTFMGAAYVFAADYDKEGRIGETSDKSMEIQSETDPMKSGNQATMNYDNNKSRLGMASNLIGMTVKSKYDEDLGTVQDLLINERGRIQYIVISHGGILGIGKDRIPIPFNDATVDSENNVILLDKVHKQMLSEAPEFTKDDWKNVGDSRFEEKIRGYYGNDFNDDYDQMNQEDQMFQRDRMNQRDQMIQEDQMYQRDQMNQGGQINQEDQINQRDQMNQEDYDNKKINE